MKLGGLVCCLVIGLSVLIDGKRMRQFNKMLRLSGGSHEVDIPKDQWFHQPLDHFDITNPNTWNQGLTLPTVKGMFESSLSVLNNTVITFTHRPLGPCELRYFVIDEYYQPGGPAFLIIEGEWESSANDMTYTAAVAYARKLNGIVFQIEHRFYGKSKPTSDLSVQNLKYLSADQALADAAFFIEGMNSQYKLNESTRWIAFGCSYAANLAAWIRDKFPHLVYGSVSYSGPVLAKLNFYEYKTSIKETLKSVSKDCVNSVKEAHNQLKTLLTQSSNLSDFTTKFKLCDPMDTSIQKDIDSVLETLANTIADVVQYYNNFGVSILTACSVMTNITIGDLIDRYAKLSAIVLEENSDECLDYKYDKGVEMMQNVSWETEEASDGDRQWRYQTCTEFGYYQTSNQKTDLFSDDIPLDYYTQQCIDIFGDKFNRKLIQHGITRTNIIYGGLDIKATRVAYVFGELDPWYPLGITSTKIPESPAIVVEGESHCACVYGSKETGSDAYKKACNRVESLVAEWCTQQ